MDEQFLEHLRDALNHLYDPGRLQHSPLAARFGVANQLNSSSALQRILIDAIASLEPQADVPTQSRAWRIYDVLFCRYVQQLGAREVAGQVGIGVRHLRREQRAALEALAYRLQRQLDLGVGVQVDAVRPVGAPALQTSPTVDEELAWVKEALLEGPTDLEQVLSAVLELIRPMADRRETRPEVKMSDRIPGLAVHPVALNQMLLTLLSLAVSWAPGNRISVSCKALPWEAEIHIDVASRLPASSQASIEGDAADLEIARNLAEMCGGRLVASTKGRVFGAQLTLPCFERLPVLAIDDNADTLQLLQRFASGTRYRLFCTQDPDRALPLAEKHCPQIIVLDVMMPQVDGWKMLGRLRQHPLTRDTPILVCTIIAQENLALSLGASGFVRKPLTQQSFLAALDEQVGLLGSRPC